MRISHVRSRRTERGFTLIELLVVIAIIAILAAVLFPVFAQAKQAAKKANGLSNVKQISLANLLYANDADDYTVPLFEDTTNGGQNPPDLSLPSTMGEYFWPVRLLPYTKSEKIFIDPSDTGDDPILQQMTGGARFDPNNPWHFFLLGLTPSYGMNNTYLSPYSPMGVPTPVSFSSLGTPASTVEYAEATSKDYVDPNNPGPTFTNPIGGNFILPPSLWNSSVSYPNATSQGQLWGRYDPKKVIVGWVDGHIKYTAITALVGPSDTTAHLDEFWNGQAPN
jgi:prepilin-type N-terminal cleavage/methylation domain-containing protein